MTRLEIDWPDEGAERVRAVEGRLRVAGEALARRPFDERLAAVAGVLLAAVFVLVAPSRSE